MINMFYLFFIPWLFVLVVECCQSRKLRLRLRMMELENKQQRKSIITLKAQLWRLEDETKYK